MTVRDVTLQNRRGTSAQWNASSRVLLAGEVGYETDTNTFRMGNGVDHWADLKVFIPEDTVAAMIADAIDGLVIGDDGNPQALTDHINSTSPHPVYDDLPSLALIYENGKV